MSSSIEFLLQKYGISPKTSFQSYSNVPSRSNQSPLKSSDLSSTLELELQRAKSEIADLKSQITSLNLQKDKELTLKTLDLDSEFKFQLSKSRGLEDQVTFLKTQMEFYETENKKMQEQFFIEKENWMLQMESLKRQLQYKQIEGNSSSSSVKLEKEENRMLREQVMQLKNNEVELNCELDELRRAFDREKGKMQESVGLKDIEMKTCSGEFQLVLQQMKQEQERLQQACANLNGNVCEKDKKIKELENVLRLSEEAREALKKQQMATQDFIKDVVSVNEQLVGSLQKSSNPKNKKRTNSASRKSNTLPKPFQDEDSQRKKVSIPSYLNNESKIQETIQNLEEEIQEINSNYKKLLIKTNDGSSDYLKYKEEIDNLAKLLEEKSKTLFAAKRKYSSMVREKIINKAIN